MKKDDSKIIQTAQSQFRLYLKNFRESQGMSQLDLAYHLGFGKPHIEKLESHTPSKVANIIPVLKTFADLQGVKIESFLSILLGKTNEVGEVCQYSKEVAEDIQELESDTQMIIKNAVTNPERLALVAKALDFMIRHATTEKINLFREIEDLSEAEAKAHLKFISTMKREKGRR